MLPLAFMFHLIYPSKWVFFFNSTKAELKLLIRHNKNGPRIPIRLIISNEQGYSLVLELYREVPNPRTGAIHLISYGPRIGALHGCLASAPHQTKDFLQLKRFQVVFSIFCCALVVSIGIFTSFMWERIVQHGKGPFNSWPKIWMSLVSVTVSNFWTY